MRTTAVLATVMTVCVSSPAIAAPSFQETFENPGRNPDYLTASGNWIRVGGQIAPPAPAAGPKINGWVPVYGENVSILRHRTHHENIPGVSILDGTTPSTLGIDVGGDYWNSAYPIGVVGEFYFGTADVRPTKDNAWNFNPLAGVGHPDFELDDLTVEFVSRDLDLTSSTPSESNRYVSFLIGGQQGSGATGNLVSVSVEMTPSCRKMDTQTVPGVSIYQGYRGVYANIATRLSQASAADQSNVPAMVVPIPGVSGSGDERMALMIIDLWGRSHKLGGNPRAGWCATGNRIRIRDMATNGHLNVDQIMVSSASDIDAIFKEAPFGTRAMSALGPSQGSDRPAAVYGFADVHTHWMSHMGSGAEPLPALTSPTKRASLSALQTRMGAMAGIPWQPASMGYFELCPSDWVNNDGLLVCTAAGQAASCSGGTCTLSDLQRDRLALTACDRTKHQNRGSVGNELVFNDENYNSVSASEVLLFQLASRDGASRTPEIPVLGLPVDNQVTHGQVGWNWGVKKFVLPERPFLSKIHQQMYWKWLKRAWQGGLRIMVSDVQHSLALDTLMHNFWDIKNPEYTGQNLWTHVGHASDEQYAAQRQVCAIKKLATASELADFVRIVDSPAEARRAIFDGKLAVVLGAELASLGRLRAGGGDLAKEIDFMRGLGIRKVTPIHQFDNELGGTAVFEAALAVQNDAFGIDSRFVASANCATADNFSTITNTAFKQGYWNRWIYGLSPFNGGAQKDEDAYAIRPADVFGHLANGQINCTLPNMVMDQSGAQCANEFVCAAPTHYFQIDTMAAGIGFNTYVKLGDLIGDNGETKRVRWWSGPVGSITNNHGWTPNFDEGLTPTDPKQDYPSMAFVSGHVNAKGLTAQGELYIRNLMSRGMLIDVEHMSQKSRNGVVSIVFPATCNTVGNAECQARAYPVIATHSDLRWATAWTTNERQLAESEVKQIMQVGGIVGLSTGYERHLQPATPKQSAITDMSTLTTCPGSPSDFALKYLAYIAAGEQAGASQSYFTQFNQTYYAYTTPRPPHWAAMGVPLGTDFNGFASQMGPRQFSRACYGNEDLAMDSGNDVTQPMHVLAEVARRNGVSYANDIGLAADDTLATYSKAPLIAGTPHQPAMRRLYFYKPANSAASGDIAYVNSDGDLSSDPPLFWGFDFNYVGHANIGLTPDMLQSMVNAIRTDPVSFMDMRYQMRYLFRGAEDFIEAWEKSVATCMRSGSTNCQGAGPNPAPATPASCDMWPSDVDAQVTVTDDTPSCMFRCGQTLTWSGGSCRCFITQSEIDNHDAHPADLCDDFKPWCQWYYNGADDPSGGNVNISVP